MTLVASEEGRAINAYIKLCCNAIHLVCPEDNIRASYQWLCPKHCKGIVRSQPWVPIKR